MSRRWGAVMGLVLAGGLLFAACGSPAPEDAAGGGGGGGGGGRPGYGSDPDEPIASTPRPRDPAPNQGRPMPVAFHEGLVDVRAHRFEKAEAVDEDTLRLVFWDGVEECYGAARAEVDYRADEVAVTLFTGRNPRSEMCIEIAVLKSVEVPLDEPLDGRAIVDATKGP